MKLAIVALLLFPAAAALAAPRQAYTMRVRPAPDIVIGDGPVQTGTNIVEVYKPSGLPSGVAFSAYGAGAWGVNVAAGDIDSATYDEMLTGPGPGAVYGPQVRGFARTGTPLAKVNFYAYGTLRYGCKPAAAALDADAPIEILTAPGPGAVFGPHIRAFNYDGVTLAAIAKVSFYAYNTLKYGANVAAGDVDGDGFDEILTGPGPSPVFSPTVRGFNYDGAAVSAIAKINFNAYTSSNGVKVTGGNVDGDAFDEILTASVGGSATDYRCFDYDGVAIAPIPGCGGAPAAPPGGHIAAGDVTGDAVAEKVLASGPGPITTVRVYSGTTLLVTFSPFTTTNGATVAVGGLGFY